MRKRKLQVAVGVAVAGVLLVVVAAAVATSRGGDIIRVKLTGFEEVPAVSTGASGDFQASISRAGDAISYRLSYANLEGAVTQAHIHLGQEDVNGGVSVWLCGNPPTAGPPGTQRCPAAPATITGTIRAQHVVGPAEQGIAPGEFQELLRAIRAEVTYVNVHSQKFPGGEIRGQLEADHGKDDD